MNNYDDWKLANGHEGEIVVYECEHCGGEIYEGDEIYRTNMDDIVHADCFNEFAHTALGTTFDIASREDK